MENLQNQIEISAALSELLDFSEIYCTAACCGLQAFEIHKSLLLRKVIDKNLGGINGIDWYNGVRIEIDSIHRYLSDLAVEDRVEIPVFYPRSKRLAEFYLSKKELQHIFLRWQRVFKQVKGTQAVP